MNLCFFWVGNWLRGGSIVVIVMDCGVLVCGGYVYNGYLVVFLLLVDVY